MRSMGFTSSLKSGQGGDMDHAGSEGPGRDWDCSPWDFEGLAWDWDCSPTQS